MPTKTSKVKVKEPQRWTPRESAERWGVSLALVHKWIAQGRVRVKRVGGGRQRAGHVFVLDADRPPRVELGSLSAKQRAAWPREARRLRRIKRAV